MTMPTHDMTACIEACLACYRTCHSTALHHCLEAGGRHTEPDHFRLMAACAEMCRASAHIMMTGSSAHRHSCRACAEICEACAADCERVGDMDACVRACRECARSCREMAGAN
ncbi:four-helix bundle copper-binding protein [Aureimonas sp. ME7]|uniref:four-helix bundle copper-binding protein n=1 Tax=Aureimonas sp. ME7 TaxID=2744252 RepID=UPI0015F5E19E|nr:four-helix bundle copper-binding protein [Aureimonas sp. ME7]